MKKTLLAFAAMAMSVTAFASEAVYTLQFGSNYNEKGVSAYSGSEFKVAIDAAAKTAGNYTWNVTNCNNNNNGWEYVKIGKKDAATTATIINLSEWSQYIDEVVINALHGVNTVQATSAKLYVLANSTDDASKAIATYDFLTQFNALSTTAADIKISITNPVADAFYKIEIATAKDTQKNTKNGGFQINKVTYNGYADASLLDPELKFPAETYTTDLESTFVSPKATSLSDGAITYSSSDPDVATVDAETGDVTVVAYGTTVITATLASTETYRAGSASYTLSVVDPNVLLDSPLGKEFTFVGGEFGNNMNVWQDGGNFGLKGSAYAGGSIYAATGIAASPLLDLKNRQEIVLNFQNAFNNYKVNNAMIDVADFEGYAFVVVKEENSEDWVELEDAITAPTAFNWIFYDNAPVSLDAYKGKKIQFGFKYVSTDECAGTWEVKNIKVTCKTASAVSEIESEENVAPVYYNLQGVRVANPDKGLYIVVKGNKSQKVIF